MEYKQFSNGTKIATIGLGTWTIGGLLSTDTTNDLESINSIKQAIEMGYTHIDTAEIYGAGHCEEIVGKAIEGFERNKLFITTKVAKTNLSYDEVLKAAQGSLERLKSPYIDLYLIHAPNSQIPIKETMRAMDELINLGLIRMIGVSNFTVEELEEAQKYSKNKIVANQIHYNLLTREKSSFGELHMESKVIPYCEKNNIIIIAYRPIERGHFLEPNNSSELIEKLSKKYNKTSSQIALNWLISKKNIITISKSTNISHLKENLQASNFKMDDEDIELLNQMKSQ